MFIYTFTNIFSEKLFALNFNICVLNLRFYKATALHTSLDTKDHIRKVLAVKWESGQ